jgi:hypothetical protein
MIGKRVKLFPDFFHVFNNGPLSVCAERYGGIDSIQLLDVYDHEGKRYPDRAATPVFSKSNSSLGRPLYGPALRFLSEDTNGELNYIYPEEIELLPAGFRSRNYSMLITQNCIAFEFNTAGKHVENFIVSLSTLHIKDCVISSLKNQLVDIDCEWGIQRLPAKYRGDDFRPDFPFRDEKAEIENCPLRFDAQKNILIHEVIQKFATGEKKLFVVLKADTVMTLSESMNEVNLKGAFPDDGKVRFVISLANDEAEACLQADEVLASVSKQWKDYLHLLRKIEHKVPRIEIEDMPSVEEFAHCAPLWQNTMLMAETETDACIRAAGNKFGFFMMWDHIYPIRDFITQNRLDVAAKMLHYTAEYPHLHTCVWASSHFILALNEYLSFKADKRLLSKAWPVIQRFFEFVESFEDDETGFVLAGLGVGVDNPQEIGLDFLFYASCINGWYHGACRSAENFALELGEKEWADNFAARAEKIEENYEKYFFDAVDGYLYAGLDQSKKAPSKIYQNTNTIALDYPFGNILLRRMMKQLAEFQVRKLRHPVGQLAVPFDSPVDCEMWRNVHMNQHLGHECKLRRYAGHSNDAYRIMNGYLEAFKKTGVAIETFNLSGCLGDELQRADWQTFSATGAYNAIVQGLCGLVFHQGGLGFAPDEDDHKISINNFAGFDIDIAGKGSFVRKFVVDGKVLNGTLQIPKDIASIKDKQRHKVEITRGCTAPRKITLTSALELPVVNLVSQSQSLEFAIARNAYGSLEIYAPYPVSMTIDGKDCPLERSEVPSMYFCERRFTNGARVIITKN